MPQQTIAVQKNCSFNRFPSRVRRKHLMTVRMDGYSRFSHWVRTAIVGFLPALGTTNSLVSAVAYLLGAWAGECLPWSHYVKPVKGSLRAQAPYKRTGRKTVGLGDLALFTDLLLPEHWLPWGWEAARGTSGIICHASKCLPF